MLGKEKWDEQPASPVFWVTTGRTRFGFTPSRDWQNWYTEITRNKEEKQGLPILVIGQERLWLPVTCSADDPTASATEKPMTSTAAMDSWRLYHFSSHGYSHLPLPAAWVSFCLPGQRLGTARIASVGLCSCMRARLWPRPSTAKLRPHNCLWVRIQP